MYSPAISRSVPGVLSEEDYWSGGRRQRRAKLGGRLVVRPFVVHLVSRDINT